MISIPNLPSKYKSKRERRLLETYSHPSLLLLGAATFLAIIGLQLFAIITATSLSPNLISGIWSQTPGTSCLPIFLWSSVVMTISLYIWLFFRDPGFIDLPDNPILIDENFIPVLRL